MKGKRGFIFPLYVTVLTLMMCGIVIMLYINQQGNVASSLVSPLAVLEVRDELEIFEIREKELILLSLEGVEWGVDGFDDEVESNFLKGLDRDNDMKEFIFSDLIWDGKVMPDNFNKDAFLENVLYSFNEGSGGLVFSRAKIGKGFVLSAVNSTKTNFVVDFLFEFEREYLVTKKSGDFILEVVE